MAEEEQKSQGRLTQTYFSGGKTPPVRIMVANRLKRYVQARGFFSLTFCVKSLSYYCQDNTQDILVVSFVHQFGTNQNLAFDLSTESDRCKGLIQGTQLLDCPQMEKEIQTCQKKGKKVLLSLGGAAGSYGLASAKDGTTWADKLWDTFGAGSGRQSRPFGKAVVDGFDLDIEAGSVEGYTAFVKTMRKHYCKRIPFP